MGCSSSQTATAWNLSIGFSPSGTDCSSMGPLWSGESFQETYFSVNSALHGSIGPAKSLLKCSPPTVTASFRHPSSLVICGLQVHLCSSVDLHDLQGHSCLSMCERLRYSNWPIAKAARALLRPGLYLPTKGGEENS